LFLVIAHYLYLPGSIAQENSIYKKGTSKEALAKRLSSPRAFIGDPVFSAT
jgi:hypothetical protein